MSIKLNYLDIDGNELDARSDLLAISNTWLRKEEIEKGHRIADTGTIEHCEEYKKELVRKCNDRMNNWKRYQ